MLDKGADAPEALRSLQHIAVSLFAEFGAETNVVGLLAMLESGLRFTYVLGRQMYQSVVTCGLLAKGPSTRTRDSGTWSSHCIIGACPSELITHCLSW